MLDTGEQSHSAPQHRHEPSQASLRESLRESLRTAPELNGTLSQQDGRALAETEDLITQLSLAPLAVQSSYAPFEGEPHSQSEGAMKYCLRNMVQELRASSL